MMDLKIQYLDFRESPAVTSAVWDHAEDLERVCPRIMFCHVVLSRPHRNKQQGRIYHVKIRLHVPRHQIIVDREPGINHAHEDIYVAIRDAFLAARRKVEDYVRIQAGQVKEKNGPMHAKIIRLLDTQDCGFILSEDQREIYFHRNALINDDFENLKVGQEVRFSEEMGEKGPQATSLHLIGSNGHRFNSVRT